MREQFVGAGSPVRRVRWSRHVAPLAMALTAVLAAPALAEPGKSRGHSQAAPGKAIRPAPKSPPPRRNVAPKPKPKPAKPKPKAKKPAPPQSRRPSQTPSRGRSQTAPHGRGAQGHGPTRKSAPASPGGKSQGHRAEKGKVTICHATGSEANPYA